jgi:uncharacterized membrane protein (DUF4010 family)
MLWRVEVLVLAISPDLAMSILPEFLLMSVPGAAFAAWRFWCGQPSGEGGGIYKNPLSLKVALQFGALYAAVVFVVKLAALRFGGAGLLIASFLSGLTDLDAIALSLSNLFHNSQVPASLAAQGIVLAAVANSILKAVLAASLGDPILRKLTILVLGSTAVLGIAAILCLL